MWFHQNWMGIYLLTAPQYILIRFSESKMFNCTSLRRSSQYFIVVYFYLVRLDIYDHWRQHSGGISIFIDFLFSKQKFH